MTGPVQRTREKGARMGMRRKKLVQNLVVSFLFVIILLFGVIPILNRDDSVYNRFPGSDADSYDVVVLGMEPEGLSSALAASRTGMRVLIVTTEPDPSSYLTDCLIQYMPQQAIRIRQELISSTGPVFAQLFGSTESTFASAEWLRGVHDLLLKESGLEMSLESTLTDVKTSGNRVESIDLYSPNGMRTVWAMCLWTPRNEGFFWTASRPVSWLDRRTLARLAILSPCLFTSASGA